MKIQYESFISENCFAKSSKVAVFPTVRVIHRRIIRINICMCIADALRRFHDFIAASIIRRITTRHRFSQKIVHLGKGALKAGNNLQFGVSLPTRLA